MQIVNKEGYGEKIYLNFGLDISSNTALTMTIEPEKGSDIDVTPTLETADTWVNDQLYEANQFVSYTITDGMFDDFDIENAIRCRMKGTATVGSAVYTAEYKYLQVTE